METGIEHYSLVCLIGTGMTQYFMCGCVHVCAYVCMYMYVSAFITHSLCLHMSRSGSYHLIGKASCSLREIAKNRYHKRMVSECIHCFCVLLNSGYVHSIFAKSSILLCCVSMALSLSLISTSVLYIYIYSPITKKF